MKKLLTLQRNSVIYASSQQRRRPETAATVALLFNKLSDNLCRHTKRRILNVTRRKMNTKSQE
ncbi:hypothetical protein BZG30_29225 [Escherichia coli]|nr:hypothetical protein [Escherichia coli]